MLSRSKKPEQKRIVWKQWRGRTPIPPWVLYLFSIPLLLAGAFGLVLGFGVLPGTLQMPRPLIVVFGLYFLFAGLVALFFACQPRMRQSRLSGISPYLADYPWSAEGISEDMESPIEKTVLGAVVLGGILMPMHIVAWFLVPGSEMAGRILAFAFLGLFDLILMVYVQQLVSFGLQRLRFGQTRVLFSGFPFFLGQTMKVTFEGGRQLRNRRMSATLRCIEEKIESTSKYDPEGQIVCREVYANASEFISDGLGRAGIAFSLPEDAPGTQLNKDLPTYWELVVESVSPGFRYKRDFLMPVYSRP